MRLFTRRLGIDLGTVNTLISVGGRIVLDEPSVVAIDQRSGEVLAVGLEAYRMLGRTPGNVSAVHPIRNGVIADFGLTEKMLMHFLKRILRRRLLRPSVVVGVSSGATSVERRALVDVVYNAGAKDVSLVEEPLAAAVGAGLPIWDPTGQLLVDIGGGTADVVVTSLGAVVCGTSVDAAGDAIDGAIASYIKRAHGVVIGETTAEQLKKHLGSVSPTGQSCLVCGQHVVTGLPTSIEVTADELSSPIRDLVREVVMAIRAALERTPPELAADILRNGVVLTGGGSLLRGLPEMIAEETGLTTIVVDEPMTCVARGTGAVAEAETRYRRVASHQKKLA